jgi:alkanesulfonate monooxygenase SsuD/methylene tetrahydromethanopterin reductase-like flavin-dependent oxidoreductase (luciferase family)
MTSSHGRGLLHLAAALDQREADDAESYVEAARLAERGALDFVTLGGGSAPHGPDALSVLARVAPVTRRIGLVPAVTTAHSDPLRIRAAVAALDRVSSGRAGRLIDVPPSGGDALAPDDGETGGNPSPRCHSVRVVDATDEQARTTAARHADVALVRVASPAQAAAVRGELRDAAQESGRPPQSLRVLASLTVDLGDGEHAAEPGHGGGGPRLTAYGPFYRGGPVDLAELIAAWHTAGAVDGFHLTPAEPLRDLERLVNGTVPLLQYRGLFRTFYPGSTLREHLGLPRPAHRYAVTGGAP